MSSKTILTCDVCKQEIDERSGQLVDMGEYGVHAHATCFAPLSALSLVELLQLDSITYGLEKHFLAFEANEFALIYSCKGKRA